MMYLEIEKTNQYLKEAKAILCPTDTIWGISCDATNFDAVEKIYAIKKREKSKSLIVLVSSFQMLLTYVDSVPENIEKILKEHDKPLTIIYSQAHHIAKNVFAQDGSIAIRIVKSGFCYELIKAFGKPIVSSSANFSNEETATNFEDIKLTLKDRVDYVVEEKYETSDNNHSSTIIKIDGENIITIRK